MKKILRRNCSVNSRIFQPLIINMILYLLFFFSSNSYRSICFFFLIFYYFFIASNCFIVWSRGKSRESENHHQGLVTIVIIASLNTLYFIYIYRMIFHILDVPFLSIFPSGQHYYTKNMLISLYLFHLTRNHFVLMSV